MSQTNLLFENLENDLEQINHAFVDCSMTEPSHQTDVKVNSITTSVENHCQLIEVQDSRLEDSCKEFNISNKQVLFKSPIINDLNHVVLDLKWETRDLIINILNRFSALLTGKLISYEKKQQLIEENNELLSCLINLGLSVNFRVKEKDCDILERNSESSGRASDSSSVDDSNEMLKNTLEDRKNEIKYQSNELILELSKETRMQIIEHLIKNQNVALMLNDSVTSQIRNGLIKENRALINALLNLPVDVNCAQKDLNDKDEAIEIEDEQILQTGSAMTFINKLSIIKQMESLTKELADLKTQVAYLKDERFKELSDIHKNETVFTYKLANLKEFLKTRNNNRKSESFYVVGIPWNLHVQTLDEKSGKKILTFYLRPLNTFDSYINWTCKVYYELRILSGSPYILNKTKQCLKTFTRYNYMDFCLSDDINNLIHFIRNDALYLQCYLKAEKISRTAF